jgi:hypothetical protein
MAASTAPSAAKREARAASWVRLTSKLRRSLPRTAAGRGGQQAEQHREGAVGARR